MRVMWVVVLFVGTLGCGESSSDLGAYPPDVAVDACSDFSFDLYRQLAKENPGENLFLSPCSISCALTMLMEGARGKTAEEMGQVLRFPEKVKGEGEIPWRMEEIHPAFGSFQSRLAPPKVPKEILDAIKTLEDQVVSLREELEKEWKEKSKFDDKTVSRHNELVERLMEARKEGPSYELCIANALWGEETFPFRKDVVVRLRRYFGTGGLSPVDFKGAPENARERINEWVREQTNQRISEILLQGDVTSLSRLVLSNAISFRGNWLEPFSKELTRPAGFTLSDGEKIKTETMFLDEAEKASYAPFSEDGGVLNKADRGGFEMLSLPYRGGEVSMVVLLPGRPDGLPAIEKKVRQESLEGWMAKLRGGNVDVLLPKFRVETNYTLNETLKEMGMETAFHFSEADFGGLTDTPDAGAELFISLVRHRALVDVNEEGTEASASTIVGGMCGVGDPVPVFHANRPFLYFIWHHPTSAILFIGRMMDPR